MQEAVEVVQVARIQDIPAVVNTLKVLGTGFLAFLIAFAITPLWTHFLFRYRIGIRIKDTSVQGEKLSVVSRLHAGKEGTPTMGGVIVWVSVILLALLSEFVFPWLSEVSGRASIAQLDFWRRSQTWLPLFVLGAAGVLGLVDDYMSVRRIGSNKGGGMRFAQRFWWLIAIAGTGAWWFYAKLGWDSIHVPAVGDFTIGWWYVPLFIFVILFSAISSNETDGLDGLNGGVLLMAFGSFALISFFQNRMDLASFCAAVAGALLAFLWFNVYPARFFMGDTGAMALGTTLGVVAMLTNSAIVLFVIVLIYVLESGSVAIQLCSKRLFGRKVFLAAPLHHHFEAKGWPEPKVVMRAWILTGITATIGTVIGIIGMGR
ncbi:MAG: phospho-N-acetylmuramoyl-pentapeptide-transferase [Candidatus Moranbacteria bacterium]|nr:phospho-N-acetylmuramoyl-pentapeptide-transferase [Candidatus Moranbacteria bacterium]NTW45445.1 phospho-N-acetylmuramoyl-pentapeptide-transferase [Candidatus Moranbacteria bacterium]